MRVGGAPSGSRESERADSIFRISTVADTPAYHMALKIIIQGRKILNLPSSTGIDRSNSTTLHIIIRRSPDDKNELRTRTGRRAYTRKLRHARRRHHGSHSPVTTYIKNKNFVLSSRFTLLDNHFNLSYRTSELAHAYKTVSLTVSF
jgi:hypothetical protein